MTAPHALTLAPLDVLKEAVGVAAYDVSDPQYGQSALTVVRRLVAAAGQSAEHDSVENHRALKDAWAEYRHWSPDTGDGIGEGE